MENYQTFDVEDFVCDEFFIEWVIDPQKENIAFWTNWQEQNPSKVVIIEQARSILSSYSVSPNAENFTNHDVLALTKHIEENGTEFIPNVQRGGRTKSLWCGIAVTLALFFAIWLYRFPPFSQGISNKNSIKGNFAANSIFNTSKINHLIRLNDGSLALLKPNSKLIFPKHFYGKTRDVSLVGEAFFEVHKDPKRPFLIHSHGIVTQVVGTSFTVKSSSEVFKVVVNTGKVLVYKEKHGNAAKAVTLIHNQQTTLLRSEKEFKKDTVRRTLILAEENAKKAFSFKEAPVSLIFTALSKAYDIDIVYDAAKYRKTTLTASLSKLPLDQKIKFLCTALNAQCDFSNGTIQIK